MVQFKSSALVLGASINCKPSTADVTHSDSNLPKLSCNYAGSVWFRSTSWRQWALRGRPAMSVQVLFWSPIEQANSKSLASLVVFADILVSSSSRPANFAWPYR